MDRDEIACLCFSYLCGIGPWRFKQLLQQFKNPYSAYTAPESELKTCLSEAMTHSLVSFRTRFDAETERKHFESQGMCYISSVSSSYPKMLQEISDPPIGIFCIGDHTVLQSTALSIAVVGTRKPSAYGQAQAKKISGELAEQGIIIVSGMALGIDTCAHSAVLASGGKTIAVLGCGADVVYPHSNRWLYQKIIESGGLIISEFPPGKTVLPGLFVARNRIISGLSKGVFVVEGTGKSGSLITAAYAAHQGRELFALPGQITTEGSIAPNMLIQQGAHVVTSVADILVEFGLCQAKKTRVMPSESLTPDEQSLIAFMRYHPCTTDDLLEHGELAPAVVMVTLSGLEIRGIIVKTLEGLWEVA